MAPMGPSRKEVEVKLPFTSAEEAGRALQRLGASLLHSRVFEDNQVYDLPTLGLRRTGRLLRLRRAGPNALLTFKARREPDTRHKVRMEHETLLDDPEETERILGGLGFEPVYRYQKYRTVFRFAELEISLDETPIGCFVELEGEPGAIDRVAGLLGFTPDRYIVGTYRDLHEADAAARGVPPGDLLFRRNAKAESP
jgi:adenylate cyclase class 2